MLDAGVSDLERRLSLLAGANGLGAVHNVRRLTGGASSLTYAAELRSDGASRSIVVKVAPAGREPVGHRDVLRQSRVLGALHAGGNVPVPEVLLEDRGAPRAVPPLFAMTFVAGDSVEPLFDAEPTRPATRDEVAGRAHEAARRLAALQQTNHASIVGVGDEVDLAAEVDRWATALATAPAAEPLGWRAVHHELVRSMPPDGPLVLGHGDYRLGNMLAVGHAITAVIDWELWAVTDARIDLAWFRLNADPDTYGRATPLGSAMPSPDELVQSYVAATGGDPPQDLAWFDALAAFKAAATWSLILKHASRSGDPTYLDVARSLPRLVARAGQLLT